MPKPSLPLEEWMQRLNDDAVNRGLSGVLQSVSRHSLALIWADCCEPTCRAITDRYLARRRRAAQLVNDPSIGA